jgi:hypothetical protein
MLNAGDAPKGSSRRDVSGKWSRPLRRRIRAKWERHRSRYEEHIEWGYIRHRGVVLRGVRDQNKAISHHCGAFAERAGASPVMGSALRVS